MKSINAIKGSTILIVDDKPANLGVLAGDLSSLECSILMAQDGRDALKIVETERPDLILLDVVMPGMHGTEVCRRLKLDEKNRDIPVIFVSSMAETVDKVKGFDLGAVDYITKPFHREEVLSRVTAHLSGWHLKNYLEEDNTKLREEIDKRKKAEETARKTLEKMETILEELRIAKETAESANHSKSQFLANMSHEIRTPMNAILGFAEILDDLIVDERQKGYLASITASGKSLLVLINDILDLSMVEAGKLKLEYTDMNLLAVFQEIKRMFSYKIEGKGLDFILDIGENMPPALIFDETRLKQVLINLVSNAVKFTEKGYIKISASAGQASEEKGTVDITFSVEDTGIGIPEEQVTNIFRAFEQQSGQSYLKYGGTGLGLAIVKRLIEMIGGKIIVTSEVGKGSTFKIVLKDVAVVAHPHFEEGDCKPDIRDVTFHKPGTILIVDDVRCNREVVKGYLYNYGFNIIETDNGEKALDILKYQRPDVVLMDVKMPVMNGYEASKIIKNDPGLKDIVIIMVTASVMKHNEEKMKKYCDSFLSKPVGKVDLVIELMNYLPFNISEHEHPGDTEEAEPEDPVLSPAVIAGLPRLKEQLEQELLPQWEKNHQDLFMDEIEEWAGKVKILAEEYGYPPMANWCQRLFSHIEAFDTEKLAAALNRFPGILTKIEKNMNPKN